MIDDDLIDEIKYLLDTYTDNIIIDTIDYGFDSPQFRPYTRQSDLIIEIKDLIGEYYE